MMVSGVRGESTELSMPKVGASEDMLSPDYVNPYMDMIEGAGLGQIEGQLGRMQMASRGTMPEMSVSVMGDYSLDPSVLPFGSKQQIVVNTAAAKQSRESHNEGLWSGFGWGAVAAGVAALALSPLVLAAAPAIIVGGSIAAAGVAGTTMYHRTKTSENKRFIALNSASGNLLEGKISQRDKDAYNKAEDKEAFARERGWSFTPDGHIVTQDPEQITAALESGQLSKKAAAATLGKQENLNNAATLQAEEEAKAMDDARGGWALIGTGIAALGIGVAAFLSAPVSVPVGLLALGAGALTGVLSTEIRRGGIEEEARFTYIANDLGLDETINGSDSRSYIAYNFSQPVNVKG